jgi:uncharacterized repeat protein (TIGR01451 family)
VAGTYTWSATYSGDLNNNSAIDQGGSAEQTVGSPASPSVLTTAIPSHVTLGTTAPTLSDSAVLSGGFFETGTITFVLTGPGGFSFTHTDTVNGNGTYTASDVLPTAGQLAGTYTWSATYSGDLNNNSAIDQGGSAEQTVVSPASPSLITTASPALTLGTTAPTLTDSAVLSGGFFETGTITFVLTGPGGFSFTHTDTVNGNGTYTAADTLPTTGQVAGTYTWSAHYSGDGNNLSVNDQGGTGEQTVVSPASPTVVTTASPAVTLGTTGATLSDSAVLSGGFFETGTITFTLTGPGGFSFTHTDTVNGNGTYTASDMLTAGAATGTYTWSAVYSGDGNNLTAHDQGGTGEQTVVTSQVGPTLVIAKAGDPAPVNSGDTVHFTIVLTNIGPGTAFNVVITDPLPDSAHLTWTTDVGTITNGVLTDDVGDLAQNAIVVIHVSAVTPAGYQNNNLFNVVTATSSNANTVKASATDVVLAPNLTITKTAANGTINSGQTAEFTIVVSNTGQGIARNVNLNDPLPDGTLLPWITDVGMITNGVLMDHIGDMAPGASITIHVSAVTPAGFTATLNNTATATSTNSNPASVNASATIIVVSPGLSSLSGMVFVDQDQDGNFMPGDIALPGVTITLTGVTTGGTSVIASLVTDMNGDFTFTGLQPGTYNLIETQPPNFIPGLNFPGTLGGVASLDEIGMITVEASQAGVNYRFTQLLPASKLMLLSSTTPETIQALTGAPAGTGIASVAEPFGANGLAPGGHYFVTGAGFGHSPVVTVYNPFTGQQVVQFDAYDPRFQGGVRVALGDVNGDGTPDIVTATGPTGSPDVRVFDGRTGVMISEFMAYSPLFAGGVFVAVGDINHDGFADVVTGPDAGGGPEVKVFNGKALTSGNISLLADFMAYDPNFNGGVRVGLGDVDGDGTPDLITGPGAGGGPDVRVFGGNNLAAAGPNSDIIREFLAFAANYSGGVNVAGIDLTGSGVADILTAAGTNSSEVRLFSGLNLSLLADFMAESKPEAAGVNIAALPGAIITGGGSTSQVQVLNAGTHSVLDSFFADPSQQTGVYVGAV